MLRVTCLRITTSGKYNNLFSANLIINYLCISICSDDGGAVSSNSGSSNSICCISSSCCSSTSVVSVTAAAALFVVVVDAEDVATMIAATTSAETAALTTTTATITKTSVTCHYLGLMSVWRPLSVGAHVFLNLQTLPALLSSRSDVFNCSTKLTFRWLLSLLSTVNSRFISAISFLLLLLMIKRVSVYFSLCVVILRWVFCCYRFVPVLTTSLRRSTKVSPWQ